MPFDKETGKHAGRKSSRDGVPNKTDRRTVISGLLDDYFPHKFKKNFNKLSDDMQMKVMLKLLEFDTAKLRSVELDVGGRKRQTMIFKIAGQEIPFEAVR